MCFYFGSFFAEKASLSLWKTTQTWPGKVDKRKSWQEHEIQTRLRLKKYGQACDALQMISSSNLRPNREEASFIIIIITIIFIIIIIIIIVVRDLRVIDNNKQERISRHFSNNCLQRRFFFFLTAHQHTSLFRRDFSNLA